MSITPMKPYSWVAKGDVNAFFGLMHSPYVHGELFLPWNVADKTPLYLSASYLILSVLSLWSVKLKKE